MAVTNATASAVAGINPPGTGTNFARATTELVPFVIPSTAASAVLIDFRGFSGGSIEVDGACTITWYACSRTNALALATPTAAFDGSPTPVAVTQVLASAGVYELPVTLFGKPVIAPLVSAGTPPNAIVTLKR